MERRQFMEAASAGRRLRVLVTSAVLFAVLAVTNAVIAPSGALAATNAGHGGAGQVFYTTSGAGNGLPNGAEIFAVAVRGAAVTTRDVGPTHGGDCGSLALSPHGTLYSMCGPLFGAQQLATIDQRTGRAHLFGVRVPGLAVMAMAFGRTGTLYAVGDCNPAPKTFECTPGPAAYNSLYRVDVRTGKFTRIGPTGAPQFFMDLAVDRHGTMLGVTTTLNPVPHARGPVPHRPGHRDGHQTGQPGRIQHRDGPGVRPGREALRDRFRPEPGPVPDRPRDRF